MPLPPIDVILRRRRPASGLTVVGSTFEAALVAQLKADVALGDRIAARVYPLFIPERKPGDPPLLPAVVYAIPTTERVRNLAGPAGIATAKVLLDVRAQTYAECKTIQEILRRYDAFRGLLAGIVVVLNTRMDDQGDTFEWPDDGGGPGTQHLTLTFYFKYRESIPTSP